MTMTLGAADRRSARDDLYHGFTTTVPALSCGRRAELIDLLAQGECTLARAGLVVSRRSGGAIVAGGAW